MPSFACRECGVDVRTTTEKCPNCGSRTPFFCSVCQRPLSWVSLGVVKSDRFPHGAFTTDGQPLCHEHRLTRCHNCQKVYPLGETSRQVIGTREDTYLREGKPPRVENVFAQYCRVCRPAPEPAPAARPAAAVRKMAPPPDGAATPSSDGAAPAPQPDPPTTPAQTGWRTPRRASASVEIRHKVTGAIIMRVERASLQGADLRGAGLRRALLRSLDLTETDFTEADLCGASLRHSNLSGARLVRADLRNANLTGAKLEGADLAEARYNQETVWPNGFDPASAGAVSDTAAPAGREKTQRPSWWRRFK